MRFLIGLVLAAAALWSGYWYVGATATERALAAWLDERQRDGWVAEYAALDTRGFPNRFDTTITGLELADPRSGVAWQAGLFQILSLSYRPHHIIAVWPGRQTLATPYEKIAIDADTMRGSVVFEPGPSLRLDRASFVLGDFALQSSLGWQAGVDAGQFHVRQADEGEFDHDVFFEATGVAPAQELLDWLDPVSALPKAFDTMRVDATVGFDAPWDRFAIEQRRPQLTHIALKELQGNWGRLDLRAAGDLRVDTAGIPEGKITLRAQNWREMMQIGIDTGAIPASMTDTVERALELLAGMSGNRRTIDAPLTFKKGAVYLGPLPLGPAPRLIIR